MEKKKYNCVDLFKFIFAIFVIAIHIDPFNNDNLNFWIQNFFGRVAVPYFFIISGFLLYSKKNEREFYSEIVPKYLKKLILMYVLWTIIYIPLILKKYNFDFKNIIWVLRDIIFSGSYGTLWYFNATIVGVFILSFLTKKYSINTVLAGSSFLYIIALSGLSYSFLLENFRDIVFLRKIGEIYKTIFLTTRNGVFEGVFLLSIGAKLTEIENLNNSKILKLLIFTSFIWFGETFLLKLFGSTNFEVTIGMVIVASLLVGISINLEIKNSLNFNVIRKCSIFLMLIHLWVNVLVGLFINEIYIMGISVRFIITTLISIFISYMIVKLPSKSFMIKYS